MLKYIFLFSIPFASFGQLNFGQGVYPFLDIRTFMSLQVDLGAQDLNYDFNSPQDFSSGILKNNAFIVQIKSNRNWQLNVSSLTPYFINYQTGQMSTMPSSTLSLRKQNTSTFVPINVTQATIATGRRGGVMRAGNRFGLDLLANVGLTQESGQYLIDLVFTLTPD